MSAKLKDYGNDGNGQRVLVFYCPGCKYGHPFHVPKWSWNGSMDKPTFSPSLLCNDHAPDQRCHSYVRDGQIQFLNDCFHELAGKTVDLPDYDKT